MQDEVKVSQADREAAWRHRPSCYKEHDHTDWLAGKYDSAAKVIQAFARHSHQAERDTLARMDAAAVIRFDRGTPGNENEMPKVISCVWMPDGEYTLYALPPAPEAGQ